MSREKNPLSLFDISGRVAVITGSIGNRLQHAFWREAIALAETGICDAEAVDIVVKASFGRRLSVWGRLENADLVGTDLMLAIHRTVWPAIDHRPDLRHTLKRWCESPSST